VKKATRIRGNPRLRSGTDDVLGLAVGKLARSPRLNQINNSGRAVAGRGLRKLHALKPGNVARQLPKH
jgi:hypothetical protein